MLLALAGLVFAGFAPCTIALGTDSAHSGALFAGLARLFEAGASAFEAVGVNSALARVRAWVAWHGLAWVAWHGLARVGSRRHHRCRRVGICAWISSSGVRRWVGLRRVALRRRRVGLACRVGLGRVLGRVALGRVGRRRVAWVVRRLTHYYVVRPFN